MATEILLMQDVPELGEQGTVVSVSDGYARNYLFPRKLAEPVTEASRRRLEKIRREQEAHRKATLADARRKAESLRDISVTIRARTSDGESLYGSVATGDIAEAINALGTSVEANLIKLEQPIKELGTYDVTVKLHADVSVTVKVWVVEE